MTAPSTLSGVLGIVSVLALVAILGLLVQWASERWQ